MAYKDEYKIARLLTDKTFMRQVRSQFSGDLKIKNQLAPPFLGSVKNSSHFSFGSGSGPGLSR